MVTVPPPLSVLVTYCMEHKMQTVDRCSVCQRLSSEKPGAQPFIAECWWSRLYQISTIQFSHLRMITCDVASAKHEG